MSARSQAGRLRSIVVKTLANARLGIVMAEALERNKNVASGSLISALKNESWVYGTQTSSLVTTRYKINKRLDCIEDVQVIYNWNAFYFVRDYAMTLDPSTSDFVERDSTTTNEIYEWITDKLNWGYWRGSTIYKVQSKARQTPTGVSNPKTYFYDIRENEKARKGLAFLIARSVNESPTVKYQTRYFAAGRLYLEFAILSIKEQVNAMISEDVARTIEFEISDIIS